MAKHYEQPSIDHIPNDDSDIDIRTVPDNVLKSFAEVFFPTIEEYFKGREENGA